MFGNGGDEFNHHEINTDDLSSFLENPMMFDTTTPLIPDQPSSNAIPNLAPKKSETLFQINQTDALKIFRLREQTNEKVLIQRKRKEKEDSEEKKRKEEEIAMLKEGFLKCETSLQALEFLLDSFSSSFDEIIKEETSIDDLEMNDIQKVKQHFGKSIKLQKMKIKLDYIKSTLKRIQSTNQTIINKK
jgi:hypothetical protein